MYCPPVECPGGQTPIFYTADEFYNGEVDMEQVRKLLFKLLNDANFIQLIINRATRVYQTAVIMINLKSWNLRQTPKLRTNCNPCSATIDARDTHWKKSKKTMLWSNMSFRAKPAIVPYVHLTNAF